MDAKIAFKLTLRNIYAAALGRIPDAWLLPIRAAYIRSSAGSWGRAAFHTLLRMIRYKHPDRQAESFVVADAPDVRLLNVNSIVMRHVYWFGLDGWEGPEIRAWQYFCADASKILEIGANVGLYTVCGGLKAGHAEYTAVEPHPHTVQILRRNLGLNRLERVRIVEAAVVGLKTADRMTLSVPALDQDEAPPGSFLASGGELSKHAAASYDVPVVGINELVAGVDLLKLDAEGYEFDILSAVRVESLRERPVIFVEVLPVATKLQRFVADLGWSGAYAIFACGPTIVRVDPADVLSGRLQMLHRTRDVILIPADRAARIGDVLDGDLGSFAAVRKLAS